MVFQNYALYPHMTVEQNMSFGLRLKRYPKAEIRKRVDEAARILDITELLARKPKQLSGGQRQRVAMGRAIVRNPKVFLFDEPLSNLDAKLRVQMRTEIKKVHQQVRTTTVYVTHDQVEAMTLADRVVVMNNGNIEQIGTPQQLYHAPTTRFVAGFIGSPAMNFIPGTIERNGAGPVVRTADNTLLPLPQDAPGEVGKAVRYGVRPAHLSLAGAGEPAIEAVVDVVEPTGDDIFVYCSMAGQEVWAMFSERHDFAPGQRIQLRPQLERVHLFDAESGQRF
jgi:multiple sugar transport system ATP-binding protein